MEFYKFLQVVCLAVLQGHAVRIGDVDGDFVNVNSTIYDGNDGVVQILPMGAAEDCFVKQSNAHNCFAGASAMAAAICGAGPVNQRACKSFEECMGQVGLGATQANWANGLRMSMAPDATWRGIMQELEQQKPVEMSIVRGKKKPLAHATLVVGAIEFRGKRFLGVIDPWGRMTTQSYDVLGAIFQGNGMEKHLIKRRDVHWVPFTCCGEAMNSKFHIPSGMQGTQRSPGRIQHFAIVQSGCRPNGLTQCPRLGEGAQPGPDLTDMSDEEIDDLDLDD